jgi:membrane protein YdbS with pleckstrin-like domain
MQFVNTEINLTDLPAAEQAVLEPISTDYLRIERIEWMITAIILTVIAAALIFFTPGMQTIPLLILVIGLYLFLVIFYRVSIEKGFPWKGYAIREHDIIFQRGWLIRSSKTVPFSRIQNCSLNAGPLERKYNLSSLSIYTAGTSGADLKISGLKTETAESIREFVLSRIENEAR